MKCSTKGAALRKEPHILPFFYPLIQTQPRLLLILTITRRFIIDKESQIRAKAKSLKKDALSGSDSWMFVKENQDRKKNKEIIERFKDLWKNFHSYLWFRRKLNKTWQSQYKGDTTNYINCSTYCDCCKKRKNHATQTFCY